MYNIYCMERLSFSDNRKTKFKKTEDYSNGKRKSCD